MGTSCNVMKLRMRSSPFVAHKWRKDEIDLYTPSPTTHKLKNIIYDRWPRREMKRMFSNYVTMLKLVTENFENKSLIRTQTHTRRQEKLGREARLKIFSHITWNNWSRNLMREKSFQLNSMNDCKIWSKVSIHT